MTGFPEPTALDAEAARRRVDELADVLVDAVAGGASVSFMAPFGHADAVAYWERVVAAVAEGGVVLLVEPGDDGRVAGTVQLHLATPPNQPHRADVAKLLVHWRARGRSVAARLMAALEREARARGRTLLTLDTASGTAERLYRRQGWTWVGVIPGYALLPDGAPADTAIFYKRLG